MYLNFKLHFLPIALFCSLLCFTTACKKSKTPEPDSPISQLSTTIDGVSYVVQPNAISGSLFTDNDASSKAVEINAALDNSGKKMTFFLNDLKTGRTTISPKIGTALSITKLSSTEPRGVVNTNTSTAYQSYSSFNDNGNAYYAYSGYIEVNYDQVLGKISASWSFTFTYANGTAFTSTGSFTIYLTNNFTTKPTSEIKDPTPVSATPNIESMSPLAGQSGTEVTLQGTNFSSVTTENTVRFNGIDAIVKSATSTKLVVTAPANAATGPVSVKVKNSALQTGPTFSYVLPPTFSAMNLNSGRSKDLIVLTGTNFGNTLSAIEVRFTSGTTTTLGIVKSLTNTTTISVEVPATASTGPISILVNGILASLSGNLNANFTILTTSSNTVSKITVGSELTGHAAIDAAGNLWVRTVDFNLLKYSSTGVLLRTLHQGTDFVQYGYFRNFCFDASGNMYIAYNSNALTPYDQVVVKYDTELRATVISDKGKLPYNFQGFNNFSAGSENDLYFEDAFNNIYTMNSNTGVYSIFLTAVQLNGAPKSITTKDNTIYIVAGNRLLSTTPKKTITELANLTQGDRDGLLNASTTRLTAATLARSNTGAYIIGDGNNKIKIIDQQLSSLTTIAGNATASALAGEGLSTKVPVGIQLFCPVQTNVIYSIPNPSYIASLNYFQIISY